MGQTLTLNISPPVSPNSTPIKDALDSLDADFQGRVRLYLAAGTYREQLIIRRDSVEIFGENPGNTTLIFGDYAKRPGSDGTPVGTFNTPTLFALGNNFRVENLSIINDAGEGDSVGQAVALAVNGDGCLVRNCRIIACQDSLFCGPLPKKPKKGLLFGGPSDLLPRNKSRQLYHRCYIQGDVDFIFGSALAYFQDCEIFSRNRNMEINGYVTAPSTAENNPYGFVFHLCKLTGDAREDSVYLGRPWRAFGKTLFSQCWMGPHIKKEGWHNWDKAEAETAEGFKEWNCTGPGANPASRVSWAEILPESEKIPSKKEILGEDFPWLSVE